MTKFILITCAIAITLAIAWPVILVLLAILLGLFAVGWPVVLGIGGLLICCSLASRR